MSFPIEAAMPFLRNPGRELETAPCESQLIELIRELSIKKKWLDPSLLYSRIKQLRNLIGVGGTNLDEDTLKQLAFVQKQMLTSILMQHKRRKRISSAAFRQSVITIRQVLMNNDYTSFKCYLGALSSELGDAYFLAALSAVLIDMKTKAIFRKEWSTWDISPLFKFFTLYIFNNKTIEPFLQSLLANFYLLSWLYIDHFAGSINKGLSRSTDNALNALFEAIVHRPEKSSPFVLVQKIWPNLIKIMKSNNSDHRLSIKRFLSRTVDITDLTKDKDAFVDILLNEVDALTQSEAESKVILLTLINELHSNYRSLNIIDRIQPLYDRELSFDVKIEIIEILMHIAECSEIADIGSLAKLITRELKSSQKAVRRTWISKISDLMYEKQNILSLTSIVQELLTDALKFLESSKESRSNLAGSGMEISFYFILWLQSVGELAGDGSKKFVKLQQNDGLQYLMKEGFITRLNKLEEHQWFLRYYSSQYLGPDIEDTLCYENFQVVFRKVLKFKSSKQELQYLIDTFLKSLIEKCHEKSPQILLTSAWEFLSLVSNDELSSLELQNLDLELNRFFNPKIFDLEWPRDIIDNSLIELQFVTSFKSAFFKPDYIAICRSLERDPHDLAVEKEDLIRGMIYAYLLGENKTRVNCCIGALKLHSLINAELFYKIYGQILSGIWQEFDDMSFSKQLNDEFIRTGRSITIVEAQKIVETLANATKKPVSKAAASKRVAQKAIADKEYYEKCSSMLRQLELSMNLVNGLCKSARIDTSFWILQILPYLTRDFKSKANLICAFEFDQAVRNIFTAYGDEIDGSQLLIYLEQLWSGFNIEKSSIQNFLYKIRYQMVSKELQSDTCALILFLLYQVLEALTSGSISESQSKTLYLQVIELMSSQGPVLRELIDISERLNCRLKIHYSILENLVDAYHKFPSEKQETKNCFEVLLHEVAQKLLPHHFSFLTELLKVEAEPMRLTVVESLRLIPDSTVKFSPLLYILQNDANDQIAAEMQKFCSAFDFEINIDRIKSILGLLESDKKFIRSATAATLASIAENYGNVRIDLWNDVTELFYRYRFTNKPVVDEYGFELKNKQRTDSNKYICLGASESLKRMAHYYDESYADKYMTFAYGSGAAEYPPLLDPNVEVWSNLISTGRILFQNCGNGLSGSAVQFLIQKIERFDPETVNDDQLFESLVSFLSAYREVCSSPLENEEAITKSLVDKLSIPSERIQLSIANALQFFILDDKKLGQFYDSLKRVVFSTNCKLSTRNGAALGLAGLIKGTGIKAIYNLEIMNEIERSSASKNQNTRFGSVLFINAIAQVLGPLIEPYVPQMMSALLVTTGDTSVEVRKYSSAAARHIMKGISAYCIETILPSLIQEVLAARWRVQLAAVEMLGNAAYLAPQQLSTSLSVILPKLTTALNDSHTQIRSAAEDGLKKFGDIITNPELRSISDDLIKTLCNPEAYTELTISKLLNLSFSHQIDGPSLAIVAPILKSALVDRNSQVKIGACKALGQLTNLTDADDLYFYIGSFLQRIMEILKDPVPQCRAASAQTLGHLIEKLGENRLSFVIPELFDRLRSRDGGVDRQGAAQGLAEILSSLGTTRLEELLPDIIENCGSRADNLREGYFTLMFYLPITFEKRFTPFVGKVIASILSGLADRSELVRDTSLKTGKFIIRKFSDKSIDLFLAELVSSLLDPFWRSRSAALELLENLFNEIVKPSETESYNSSISTYENGRQLIIEKIGQNRFRVIMSSVYILVHDTVHSVSTAALLFWRKIVVNTPKMISNLLDELLKIIVHELNSEKKGVQEACLSSMVDVVQKVGDKTNDQIIKFLQQSCKSDETDLRMGISCVLLEFLKQCEAGQLEDFKERLLRILVILLLTANIAIQENAFQIFDEALRLFEPQILNEILPLLMNKVESTESEENRSISLKAITGIASKKADLIFPVILPDLLRRPVSTLNAKALSQLVQVAGTELRSELPEIIRSMIATILLPEFSDYDQEEFWRAFLELIAALDSIDTVTATISTLFDTMREGNEKKFVVLQCFHGFFADFSGNYQLYEEFSEDFLAVFISCYEDENEQVCSEAIMALSALISHSPKASLGNYSKRLSLAIRGLHEGICKGFENKDGIRAFLPIITECLVKGNATQRIQAFVAISELLPRCSVDACKPFVTQFTGPLIRTMGERYSEEVKIAGLKTLHDLLSHLDNCLRPFAPQLQRTFTKSLTDPLLVNGRENAAVALGFLAKIQARCDPLLLELLSILRQHQEEDIRRYVFLAIYDVLMNANGSISAIHIQSISDIFSSFMTASSVSASSNGNLSTDKSGTIAASTSSASGLLMPKKTLAMAALVGGALPRVLDEKISRRLVFNTVSMPISELKILSVNAMLLDSTNFVVEQDDILEQMVQMILVAFDDKSSFISENAAIAIGKLLCTNSVRKGPYCQSLANAVISKIADFTFGANDIVRLSLYVLKLAAERDPDFIKANISSVIPVIAPLCSSTISQIRVAVGSTLAAFFCVGSSESESILLNAEKFIKSEDIDPKTAKTVLDRLRKHLTSRDSTFLNNTFSAIEILNYSIGI